jgi:site-specific DNA-methyltransferase (adenine-specific)
MTYQVYNQSCIDGMREHVADESVDLIFTDPPYGIDGDGLDVHYHRDESNVVQGYIDVPLTQYAKFSQEWISECARVLRPGGSLYIVSGYTNLHHVLNALHSTDLEEINHIIAKYSFGVSTKNKFVSSHYHVLFWQKPDKIGQ